MCKTSGQVDYSFRSYVQEVLSRVDFPQSPGKEEIGSLAVDLADTLQTEGQANRIWRWVLPGVPEALESFRTLEIKLVALSNSDGTAELSLREAGLRNYFSTVIDSAIVGYEKNRIQGSSSTLSPSREPRRRVPSTWETSTTRTSKEPAMLVSTVSSWILLGTGSWRIASLFQISQH